MRKRPFKSGHQRYFSLLEGNTRSFRKSYWSVKVYTSKNMKLEKDSHVIFPHSNSIKLILNAKNKYTKIEIAILYTIEVNDEVFFINFYDWVHVDENSF